MALSNTDVQKQIMHMVAFIEQEAVEKVEEIDAKAEEEFSIEKGRLVQEARNRISEQYDRKEKQVELQRKIQSSNTLNQARLQVLKHAEEHIRNVLEEARQNLAHVSANQSSYSVVLEKLLLQGLFQLMEQDVGVRCREADLPLLQSVMGNAQQKFKEQAGFPVNVIVDTANFLSPKIMFGDGEFSSCGGIELFAKQGRVRVVNTLEKRLEMIAQQLLPQIRCALFGSNPNRKFLD